MSYLNYKEEQIKHLKPGDEVIIKTYNHTPSFWNSSGQMNRFMGKKVKILKLNNNSSFTMDNPNGHNWHFLYKDIEEVVDDAPKIVLPKELFEI